MTGLRHRLVEVSRSPLPLPLALVAGLLLFNDGLNVLVAEPRLLHALVDVGLTILIGLGALRRSRRQRALDRDAAHLSRLVDQMPLATVALDDGGRVITWNESAERLFGWPAEEVVGKPPPMISRRHSDSSEALFERVRGGERLRGVEIKRTARDGRELELAAYTSPLGRNGTLVLYDEIGDRKRATRDRDAADRRYRALIEALPLITYIDKVDETATNVYTSPQAVDVLGWSLDDWASDPHFFTKILHPEDRERVIAAVARANETRETFDEEYRLRHREGWYVWLRDRSTIVDDGESEPVARGFLLDITQQKRLEEQLLQSQKMDALGQFAGGIAHDFNNLLTGIGGYADLAASSSEPGSTVARCLDGIKSAAAEAAGLTSRLLAFSRRTVPERRLVDVNHIVVETSKLLDRLVRDDVRVRLELTQPLPPVAADLGQLKQVVLNLALNARDAMHEGGTITIETATAPETVLLRVRDTGAGMDAVTRSRAVEPFFTTKAEGEGTGLGLSVVYGVVDGLGGRLSIDSAVGLGTIVEVSLPAAEGVAQPLADEPGVEPVVGAERVLVVEDRDVVRELARDVLEASGFEVAAVANGREALDLVASAAPFDALVTDVVMPEMSGAELARALRAQRSELPVVYMSGYTDDVLSGEELAQPATAFVRKPFGNAELVAVVRETLDYWDAAALANAPSAATSATG